ncbi:hypothetical protein BGZ61DRAFT_166024 [Ilyonectria robusta]|uniref:uncharacterized protein n=1 Tax=Ilyonectria robusta TaxID=1079257 RepID=UPI001E8C9FA0|nr:uncharacterized protein BGZ61DRAFT_166024 [Ilyonectria robusta]KAH8733785.1 hypothetical protein BGZ61DRAFT_166024 [Ilyonectria robusta]
MPPSSALVRACKRSGSTHPSHVHAHLWLLLQYLPTCLSSCPLDCPARLPLTLVAVSTPAATVILPIGYGTFRLPVNSFTGRTKLAYRLSLRLRCHSHSTVIDLLSFVNCRPNGQSIAPQVCGEFSCLWGPTNTRIIPTVPNSIYPALHTILRCLLICRTSYIPDQLSIDP